MFALSHLYPSKYENKSKTRHGIIALHADGKCVHQIDGKTVYVHKENPAKFKRGHQKK